MFKLRSIALLLLVLVAANQAYAQKDHGYAVIASVQGKVEIKPKGGSWAAAKSGMSYGQGDVIRTKGDSWAMIDIYEGEKPVASVELKQLSELRATIINLNKRILLDLALGEVMVKAGRLNTTKAKFEVKTPTSFIEVMGKATFSVNVEKLD
jgi:hypothetical protein